MDWALCNPNISPLLPRWVPGPMARILERALGLRQIASIYDELRQTHTDRSLVGRLLQTLAIETRIAKKDLEHVPRKGAVLVVVNHPSGLLDGAVLATLLSSLRDDVRVLANHLLASIPEIRDLLIPADVLDGKSATRANASSIRQALKVLADGGLLVVFPAGEVSRLCWRRWSVTDSAWNPATAAILRLAQQRGIEISIVPIYLDASNSFIFHGANFLHPKLPTLLLGWELLNKRGRAVEVRIGNKIPAEKILSLATDKERIEYLRWRTYLLASRNAYKPRTALPMRGHHDRIGVPVIDVVPSERMAEEIAALAPARRLAGNPEFSTYLAKAAEIPSIMQEIGRLREITFRAAGEGTGRATDLDEFDRDYLHLFVWNEIKQEVVGAYRLAATDRTSRLYTATLFQYSHEFLDRMGPALELGRSFVRLEYQRGFQPLLLLWKGIGAYVARNPQYRVLFGPVSISNQYQPLSRRLIVSFLERHALWAEFKGLVVARNPLRHNPEGNTGLDLEDLSALVSDIDPGKGGIPVLLRQYLRLGGKLVGFNVDRQFADVLDGLIVVDLNKTDPRLVERYLGKAQQQPLSRVSRGIFGAPVVMYPCIKPKNSRGIGGNALWRTERD
jgi:putative hemolysin